MTGGTRHLDFGMELAKRGYKVYIFASDFSVQKLRFLRLHKDEMFRIECIKGVNFVWIRTTPYAGNNFYRLKNQFIFAKTMYRIGLKLPRPDIIIGASPQLMTAFSALLLSVRFRIRFISDIFDLWPESLVQLRKSMKYNPYTWILKFLERSIYKKSSDIIVAIDGFRNYISSKGIDKDHIHFISNCTYPNHFKPDTQPEELKKRYGISRFTLAYTGAIGFANNLQLIVEVAKKLTDLPVDFIILGEGPLRKTIEEQIRKEGITNVRIYDTIPKRNILSFLANVDACFITVQNTELFNHGLSPNKLFDYMLAGKPVLITASEQFTDMIKKADCGIYIEPDDPDAFASAVRKLYSMKAEDLKRIGQNGRNYVLEYFSEQSLGQRLFEILH